jgi:SAM-dependent methyltransferase
LTGTRAFYEEAYAPADPAEQARLGRWRALGAEVKAAHVRSLCARTGLKPATIAELGCGDGSLLSELAADAVVDGFELSPTAAGYARVRGVARRVEAFDGASVRAGDGSYDLAVLSHVVEHVPDPVPLLKEAGRIAPRVLVEVPLEANRSARRPAKRAEAARIGHLHALDRSAVRAWLAAAGLRPQAQLADSLPLRHHRFLDPAPRAAAKWAARRLLHVAAPRSAERLFTVHYAVLATRA